MPNARLAQAADLASLLELYRVADVSSSAEPIERAERIWLETLSHDGVAFFVSDLNTQIIATCMLITAPNLLRAEQRHGFLENVVTHPEFQGQGHGHAVVEAALAAAWSRDCYHVLLQSGRKTLACIASISVAASSRASGSATSRAAPRNRTVFFIFSENPASRSGSR
jgi:GNAT superfamily N-acetyltransferase